MQRLLVLAVVALVGCDGAHRVHGGGADDGPDGGMAPVTCGAVTCDQIPPPTCEGNTLREYTAACADATCSYPATETECGAAGCCGDHCCELAPSNADVTGTIEPTGIDAAPADGVFNTDANCSPTSVLGRCEEVVRPGLPEACVCRMDTLTIGTLEIKGARALVILAHDSVTIHTTLDISGDHRDAGAGAMPDVYTTTVGFYGAVGGSFATQGGGATGNPTTVAATFGDPTLIPLYGGMRGQSGWLPGGGGGGALQIVAGNRIEVVGSIFAGGGGGEPGSSVRALAGGTGGGSGGAILLEAPTITMTGRLDANGGGGGGGDGYGTSAGSPWGEDANDDMPSGGQGDDGGGCSLYGYTSGGDGGNGATQQVPAGVGQAGDSVSGCLDPVFVGGGGGGGGLGRIRINTLGGTCACTGVASPAPSFGSLGVK
jgi:hypothetical protein